MQVPKHGAAGFARCRPACYVAGWRLEYSLTVPGMAKHENDKGVIVSFRVDRHLADVLNKVPDKSSFIRDVILRSFYETCPMCRGRGVLPEEISRWTARLLKSQKAADCDCCNYSYPAGSLPRKAMPASPRERFVCPHCQSHEHEH